MESLPGDIHRYIADILFLSSRYSIKDIVSYCKTSRTINVAIYSNRNYWMKRATILTDHPERLQGKSLSDLRKALFLFEKRRPDPVYFAQEGYEKVISKSRSLYKSNVDKACEEAAKNGYFDIVDIIIKMSDLKRLVAISGAVRGLVIEGYDLIYPEYYDKLYRQLPGFARNVYRQGLAKGNHFERFDKILRENPSEASPALIYAVESGSVPLVNHLLKYPIATTHMIESLRHALLSNQILIYNLLKSLIADETLKLQTRYLIPAAVESGHQVELRHLLDMDPYQSKVALKEAAKYNQVDILKYALKLMQDRSDAFLPISIKETMLEAISNGHENIVRILLPLLDTEFITDLIRGALKEGELDIVYLLLPYDQHSQEHMSDYLHAAIDSRDIETVEEILRIAPLGEYEEALKYAMDDIGRYAIPTIIAVIIRENVPVHSDNLSYLLRTAIAWNKPDVLRNLLQLSIDPQTIRSLLDEETLNPNIRAILEEYLKK